MLLKVRSLADVSEGLVNSLHPQMNRQHRLALFSILTKNMLTIPWLDILLSFKSLLCSVPPKVWPSIKKHKEDVSRASKQTVVMIILNQKHNSSMKNGQN